MTKFCGQVTPGEGRLVLCMMAHEDKVSNECDYALYSATRNIERAIDRIEQTADACWPDIEKQCSETAPGGGRRRSELQKQAIKFGRIAYLRKPAA